MDEVRKIADDVLELLDEVDTANNVKVSALYTAIADLLSSRKKSAATRTARS